MSSTTHSSTPLDGDRGLSRAARSERTAALIEEAHSCGDETRKRRLLDEVILINRGVAEAVASRYRGRGISQDDLVQVAYEGLTKAVNRFDPSTRNDLLTYAVPTIRGEVMRHFRDHGWSVRPPRRVQELQWRVNQCIERLEHELGREPRDAEVIEELGIDAAEYREALEAFGCFQPTSLDQPVHTDATSSLGDLIPDVADQHGAADARVALAPVVRRLSERDRRILHLRFFEDRTQAEIGEDLGVTQMQVSRLLSRILGTLREDLESLDAAESEGAPASA